MAQYVLTAIGRHRCILGRADELCTARQIRNGLLLANIAVWIAIIMVVSLLV